MQLLPAGDDEATQAVAVVAEFRRLAALAGEPGHWSWRRCAVIARHWVTLDPVRSLVRRRKAFRCRLPAKTPATFWRLRETQRLLASLERVPEGLVDAGRLEAWVGGTPDNEWSRILGEAHLGLPSRDR